MKKPLLLIAAALFSPLFLAAQKADSMALVPKSGAFAAAATIVTIPAGKRVVLRVDQSLNPKKLKKGDVVEMINYGDLVIDGKIVIRDGAEAYATVVSARSRGVLGRPSSVVLGGFSVVTIDDQTIELSGETAFEASSANRSLAMAAAGLAAAGGLIVTLASGGAAAPFVLPFVAGGALIPGKNRTVEQGEKIRETRARHATRVRA